MKSGKKILQERADKAGIEIGNEISGQTFSDLGLPMVVACKCCTTTMVFTSCVVDDEGYCFCPECAGDG